MSIKQILRFVKNEFIYGGHLLSFGASSIVFTSAIILNIKITLDFIVIVYLIFYVSYSYNRLKEFKKDFLTNFNRTKHIERYIKYIPLINFIFILIIIIILFYNDDFNSFIFGLTILLFGYLYTDFFKEVTKKVAGFKNFYVAFVWATLVIFLAFYYNIFLSIPLLLLFIFVFLRWLLNTIFFDLKDIDTDKKDNLQTVPVLLGRRKTLVILQNINMLSLVPIIIGVYENIFPFFALSLCVFYFYSFYYLRRARKNEVNIQKLSYVMVDGEYVFWPMTVLLIKIFISL